MAAERPAMASLIEAFERQLRREEADYICDDSLGGTLLRVRFLGRFEAAPVVWDARLLALGVASEQAQYITIGAPTARGLSLHVGLKVACIDRPTLLKTLIMVRNYKRLRYGRHEFGPRDSSLAQRDAHS